MTTNDIGFVETQLQTLSSGPGGITLEAGQVLSSVTVAFETYGRLNEKKSNAILICHALTGDAHAAGSNFSGQRGWWDPMIGPGKAFDTNRFFVICSNVLGGCQGTTGPASIDEKTNKPFGTNFPVITISDMVKVQKLLIDFLMIDKLLSVAGGSMGGMQVLEWVAAYPHRIRSAIPIATAWKQSPQQLALAEVGRQAIMKDPAWNGGYYYTTPGPIKGLSLARMIGHITYMSETSMEEKFARNRKNNKYSFSFGPEFEVESYLNHNGDTFVNRFDANSYLYISRAISYFDLSGDKLIAPGLKFPLSFLVLSFLSDWLYPTWQSKEIARYLMSRQQDTTYCEINSKYGHDAFLLEFKEESKLIKHFLKKVANGTQN